MKKHHIVVELLQMVDELRVDTNTAEATRLEVLEATAFVIYKICFIAL